MAKEAVDRCARRWSLRTGCKSPRLQVGKQTRMVARLVAVEKSKYQPTAVAEAVEIVLEGANLGVVPGLALAEKMQQFG